MSASLQEDLAALTGEEVYHLVLDLDKAMSQVEAAPRHRHLTEEDTQALNRLWLDLNDSYLIALAQVARITIPIREAAAIVYRTRYARGRPVRVPGT